MKKNTSNNRGSKKSQKLLAMILAILMVAGMATTAIAFIFDAIVH